MQTSTVRVCRSGRSHNRSLSIEYGEKSLSICLLAFDKMHSNDWFFFFFFQRLIVMDSAAIGSLSILEIPRHSFFVFFCFSFATSIHIRLLFMHNLHDTFPFPAEARLESSEGWIFVSVSVCECVIDSRAECLNSSLDMFFYNSISHFNEFFFFLHTTKQANNISISNWSQLFGIQFDTLDYKHKCVAILNSNESLDWWIQQQKMINMFLFFYFFFFDLYSAMRWCSLWIDAASMSPIETQIRLK